MTALEDDLRTIARALTPLEQDAAALPWAKDGAWSCRSHVGSHDGCVLVDLHGLSVRLALRVLTTLEELDLATGQVMLVTGGGRHTGGHSKLREALFGALEAHGIRHHAVGKARIKVVFDADRARSGGMGWFFWLFVAMLFAGIVASVWEQCR